MDELTVADASSFDVGDRFEVFGLKPNDTVTVPLSVEVRRDGDGYVVDAPDDVRLILGEEEDGEEEEDD